MRAGGVRHARAAGRRPKIAARLAREYRERRRLEAASRFGAAIATFDGAPTIHKHYDAEGNLTGWTEIVSPWDDDTRAEAEALVESDRLICQLCGNPREDCSDPDRPWFAQRHICYARREQEAADRKYRDKHKEKQFSDRLMTRWTQNETAHTPYTYSDGVRVYVAPVDVNPDDHFI